jgi:prepilin-type N-terminal cleavage/methylation domain-containing protein
VNISKQKIGNTQGFTIVELLIVIVVIAILAAISIVAYNGIQQRADVSARKAEMSQLQRKIQVDALQHGGESIHLSSPLVYGIGRGSWSLTDPVENAQMLTLYSVFDTSSNMDAAWSVFARPEPTSSTNYFSLRANSAGSSIVQGYWQTSAQTNRVVGSASNIRDTTGRHVGWITADGSSVYAGFDNNAEGSTTLSTHTGWTFDTLSTYQPAGIAPVAVLLFAEYHDMATRTEIIKWLDREYTINYYN